MSGEDSKLSFLVEPLSISDLFEEGAFFEVTTNLNEDPNEELMEDTDDGVELVDSTSPSPWLKPFAELKAQMIEINPNLYKKIVEPGEIENGLMPEKSRVCIRYDAYWEGEKEPFDSTSLVGSDCNFSTGFSLVLEGLETAVLTMYKGEKSQFLISYKLLYGELGCPPRIKRHADGLYVIKLISFNAIDNEDTNQSEPSEIYQRYSAVVDTVKELHLKGIHFFDQGMITDASYEFEKAVDILRYCQLKNFKEQRDQTNLLIKLCTNLTICYNKRQMSSLTCVMCQEIRRLTNENPSCEAVFQEGLAMLHLGEYQKSRKLFLSARVMEPHNACINKKLKDLENQCVVKQKKLWLEAMGFEDYVM